MPKGQKKTKGTPELYNEVKKQVNLSLTPTAIDRLDKLAKQHRLSRSEFVEQIARGFIPLAQIQDTNNSISRKFVFYPTRSLSLRECYKLPEEMGSFLVSDLINFAYIDSCPNLKLRFQNDIFLEELKKYINNSKISSNNKIYEFHVFWIQCDHPTSIKRTENELINQFRSLKSYENFYRDLILLLDKDKNQPQSKFRKNDNM